MHRHSEPPHSKESRRVTVWSCTREATNETTLFESADSCPPLAFFLFSFGAVILPTLSRTEIPRKRRIYFKVERTCRVCWSMLLSPVGKKRNVKKGKHCRFCYVACKTSRSDKRLRALMRPSQMRAIC